MIYHQWLVLHSLEFHLYYSQQHPAKCFNHIISITNIHIQNPSNKITGVLAYHTKFFCWSCFPHSNIHFIWATQDILVVHWPQNTRNPLHSFRVINITRMALKWSSWNCILYTYSKCCLQWNHKRQEHSLFQNGLCLTQFLLGNNNLYSKKVKLALSKPWSHVRGGGV